MKAPFDNVLAAHLNASLQVIGVNVNAYYGGALHTYRPIAAELRKLLCDSQARKDISLLPQCFPGMQLHPLVGSQSMIDEQTVLCIPARMSFDGAGGSDMQMLFNESGPMLPVSDWLSQRLFSYNMTLKDFIRSVADKEGAHADKELNDTLKLTKSVLFPGNESLADKAIVAIARYVVNVCAIRALVMIERANHAVRAEAAARGRGVHLMDLHRFCHMGIHSLPFDFIASDRLSDVSFDDEAKRAALTTHVQTYDPGREMLVTTIDLNRRGRSVYGIRFQAAAA